MRKALAAMVLAVAACALPPPAAEAKEAPETTWVTLGTSGGPPVRVERAQIANALLVPDGGVYLFDTGNDVQRQMARGGNPEAMNELQRSIAHGMAVNHLTPERIGQMAAAGGVGAVLLTHFVPSPEAIRDRAIYAREIAWHYEGPVTLAEDLGRY